MPLSALSLLVFSFLHTFSLFEILAARRQRLFRTRIRHDYAQIIMSEVFMIALEHAMMESIRAAILPDTVLCG